MAFFGKATGRDLAERGRRADLMAANNVLAHVPHIGDFVAGFREVLKDEGVLTFEFPHLLNLIEKVQFDTIYHEHFSYLSLLAVGQVLRANGLRPFDVELLPTHRGSLRLFCCHAGAGHEETTPLAALREREAAAGLGRIETYAGFAPRVEAVRDSFRTFLAAEKAAGRRVAAYGAAAKGNTFLNYCGTTTADVAAVYDASLAKQGRFLPGSHLPDPGAVGDRPAEARRPGDPALEPEGRDHGPDGLHRRLGRPFRHRLAGDEGRRLMRFSPTQVRGVALVEIEPHEDERGAFARLQCPDEFAEAGHPFAPVQTSLSRNPRAGALRGLHYQPDPHAETKLVRAVRGRMFDVAVDLRPNSPTYRRWTAAELSADNARALFIPPGVAHGFLTLEPDTDVLYQIAPAYTPGPRGWRALG